MIHLQATIDNVGVPSFWDTVYTDYTYKYYDYCCT